jgi:hypothetical protein
MALAKTWEFSELKGTEGVIRAAAWTIIWTDPDYPGTEVRSGGVTTDGIEIPADTATHEEIRLAVEASLGPQLDQIRAHAANVMVFRHRTETMPVIDVPGLRTAPTAQDVIAERSKRLSVGFDYNFGDARGVHRIGTTPDDLTKWDEVTKLSSALIATGQPNGPISIVTDTGPSTVTAIEWQHILIAAGAFRQPIYDASFGLLAMDPIPADFADDAHWVAAPAP